MTHFRRSWANLLGAALAAFVLFAGAGLAWLAHRQALSYLRPHRQEAPGGEGLVQAGIAFHEVALHTADGLRLDAWFTPPENGVLILVAHGYGDRRPEAIYALFARNGYGVLAWDFRAHGGSQGELATLGYFETLDVEAALDFAGAQPGVAHVGAWGGSMGAVTLIRAAVYRPEIEALVADSPFPSLEEELQWRVPFPVLGPLIQVFAERESGVQLQAIRPIDDIRLLAPRPVFLIQGMGDHMVPPDSAQRLYEAAGEPRQLWVEPGVPHLGMHAYHPARYAARVLEFFETYLLTAE